MRGADLKEEGLRIEFPALTTLTGNLFPLVQLELNEASAAVQDGLGGWDFSAADVGKKCLLRIADWGSSGGAQIIYKTTKNGETQFDFWNCVR